MIYLIFGKDTFRANRKLKDIIERYRKIHRSGLNLKFFDLKERSFEDFKEEFEFSPMFFEKKLFILKNASQNQQFKEKFLKKIDKFQNSKEIILFFEEGEIRKDHFFDKIKEFAKFQEFKLLDQLKLKVWVREEFKRYNVDVDDKVVEKLAFLVGNDLWRMSEEIKKLVALKRGKKITENDIERVITFTLEVDIFKVIDAISMKNKKLAFQSLHSFLKRDEKYLDLFSLIKFQFRNLIKAKELIEKRGKNFQIINKLNLHPFIVEKILKVLPRFTMEDLKRVYQKIFSLDLAIKTGKIEPDLALDLLLIDL
jgi:DNA polymerase-3 subunit delta